jgi:N-acetylglucosamine-6-phosphate deacetylase
VTTYSSTRVLVGRSLVAADVVVEAAAIVDVQAHHAVPGDRVDLGDLVLAPGLVDVQVNGAFGIDLTTEPERLWELAERLPSVGLTAFCPTIVTAVPGTIGRALEALAARPEGFVGAEPLGLHLEGPMISPSRPGAHQRHLATGLIDTSAWAFPAVRMVTLAPEVAGIGVIIDLVGRGVTVAVGHTDADFDTATAAFDAGARHATHLFSAMRPIGHRDPGVVVAALLDDRVTVAMIPDGVHAHPAVVRLVARLVGPGRLVATTDSVAAAGMPPGRHRLAGRDLYSDGHRVVLDDGTLAGSVLTPAQSVGRLAGFAHLGVAESLLAHTEVPARVVGADGRGTVAPGAVADLVALRSDGSVALALTAGAVAHRA